MGPVKGSVHYLDRHNVDCPRNTALKSFFLRLVPKNRSKQPKLGFITYQTNFQMRWDYSCVKTQCINSKEIKTNLVEAKRIKYSSKALNSIKFHLNGNEVLGGFKLQRVGSKIRYVIKTCDLKAKKASLKEFKLRVKLRKRFVSSSSRTVKNKRK